MADDSAFSAESSANREFTSDGESPSLGSAILLFCVGLAGFNFLGTLAEFALPVSPLAGELIGQRGRVAR